MPDLVQNPKINATTFIDQTYAIKTIAESNGFEVEASWNGLKIIKRWKADDGSFGFDRECMEWHVVFNLASYPKWLEKTFTILNRNHEVILGKE